MRLRKVQKEIDASLEKRILYSKNKKIEINVSILSSLQFIRAYLKKLVMFNCGVAGGGEKHVYTKPTNVFGNHIFFSRN